MGLLSYGTQTMRAQRGHLIGWVPVCLAVGIGAYFAQRVEPSASVLLWGAGGAALLVALAVWAGEAAGPVILGAALVLIGFDLAAWRAHAVGGPVLAWRYYGPIAGRVVALDRSQSDAQRLTLDQVVLERISTRRTPLHVRVSLHGDRAFDAG